MKAAKVKDSTKTTKVRKLYVRRVSNREVVKAIEVHNPNQRHVDRVVRGLLINMDRANFYVDDSEFDDLS